MEHYENVGMLMTDLMTTMLRSSCRVLTPGMENPCTRFICRSRILRSWTFKLCEEVLWSERGVNSVPLRHTRFRCTDSRTFSGTSVLGSPDGVLPERSGNLHTTRHPDIFILLLSPPLQLSLSILLSPYHLVLLSAPFCHQQYLNIILSNYVVIPIDRY
jgi:hypothetical protein